MPRDDIKLDKDKVAEFVSGVAKHTWGRAEQTKPERASESNGAYDETTAAALHEIERKRQGRN